MNKRKDKNSTEVAKEPITINKIIADLKKLGVNKGDIIIVHSSLSKIGYVCGDEYAVIIALLESVGSEGTIVMPAHTTGLSNPEDWINPPVPKEWFEIIRNEMPTFDILCTPTFGIGKIPEVFRKCTNTVRSNHPQVSFTANGKLADYIVSTHELTPQFGEQSPLGSLYKLNAKVLLLGVDYDKCTSFHLSEAKNQYMSKVKIGAPIMEDNKRIWKWFYDYDYDNEDFIDLGNDFENRNKVELGKVGLANCKLFDMKSSVDFGLDWLNKNRFKELYNHK